MFWVTFWVAVFVTGCIAGVGFLAYFGSDVRYQATIERIFPSSPNKAFVDIDVTNLGTSSATPTCRVELNSADHAITGVGTLHADRPLPGGSSEMYLVPITVTPYRAAQVTYGASSVTCQ